MGKVSIVKLDSDDIMEILLEYYQEKFADSDVSKGIILGSPDDDLRFVAVFGKLDDPEIQNIDLEEVDRQNDYNGDHAFLKNNPDYCFK